MYTGAYDVHSAGLSFIESAVAREPPGEVTVELADGPVRVDFGNFR